MIALLVEDEPLIAMLGLSILKDMGYDVFEARTKDEALSVLSHEAGITLLFTDVQLADGSSGADLAHVVAADRPDVHIVVTSGHKRPAVLPDGTAFLPKPYTVSQLASVVRPIPALPAPLDRDAGFQSVTS